MRPLFVALTALCLLGAVTGCHHTMGGCCGDGCDGCDGGSEIGAAEESEPMADEPPVMSGTGGMDQAPAQAEPMLPMPKPLPKAPAAMDGQQGVPLISSDVRWAE